MCVCVCGGGVLLGGGVGGGVFGQVGVWVGVCVCVGTRGCGRPVDGVEYWLYKDGVKVLRWLCLVIIVYKYLWVNCAQFML